VFFYDLQSDGFSLDDKRDPVARLICRMSSYSGKKWMMERVSGILLTVRPRRFAFRSLPFARMIYDLSINRYKRVVHERVKHDKPILIVGRLRKLEERISADLAELEDMLK